MNGKKQKRRLENILFKLKKTEVEDEPPFKNYNLPSSDQGISHGNGDASNGNNSPTQTAVTVESKSDGTYNNSSTNRRSSRKPSKRKRGLPSDGPEGGDTSSSHQTDATSQLESRTASGESNTVETKEVYGSAGADIENIQIKIEKDDSEDWPCMFNDAGRSSDQQSGKQSKENTGIHTYSCRKCSEAFPSFNELDKHLDTHQKQERHNFSVQPCYICGKSFANEDYLSRHIASHDSEIAQSDQVANARLTENTIQFKDGTLQKEYYKCYRCRRVFPTDDALQMHKCKKGLIRPYGCGRCGRSYTHFSNLTNHLTVHKDGLAPDLECYQCGQRFMYSIELRRHVSVHIKADYTPASVSRAPVKSSTASASTSTPEISSCSGKNSAPVGESPESLEVTLPVSQFVPEKKTSRRTTPKVNPCQVCGKIFFQRSYLTMHMKMHNEKKYECNECGKKFTYKKSLEIHVRSHTGERPYKCDMCSKDFARQDSLHKHMKMHMGVKPFVCETCGRQFGDKFELQRHSFSHSQEKPHKCTQCNKAYNDKKRLKEHMFHHSGNLPYTCEVCGKGYARKYRYQQHMDQHAGETKFECEVCHKGFYRRSDLNSHMVTHSKQKNFKCETCGMEFLRVSYLRRHMVVHSNDKPHHCLICGKDFSRKNTLQRHLLIHKRKEESPEVEDEFAEINERYNNYTTDFGYGIAGSVAPLAVSNTEERDIMKDIQAVIGLGDEVNVFE